MSGRQNRSRHACTGSRAMSDLLHVAAIERQDHRKLASRASAALDALQRVEDAAWQWADGVRACVEERAGLGVEDERVLNDPDYGAALDRCAQLSTLKAAIEQALHSLRAVPAIDMTASPALHQAQNEVER